MINLHKYLPFAALLIYKPIFVPVRQRFNSMERMCIFYTE